MRWALPRGRFGDARAGLEPPLRDRQRAKTGSNTARPSPAVRAEVLDCVRAQVVEVHDVGAKSAAWVGWADGIGARGEAPECILSVFVGHGLPLGGTGEHHGDTRCWAAAPVYDLASDGEATAWAKSA